MKNVIYALFTIMFVLVSHAQRDLKIEKTNDKPLILTEFLGMENDNARRDFDFILADRACKFNGMRLPTIRELAEQATEQGAEILEIDEILSGKTPREFTLIEAVNPDGDRDSFYYSYRNYQPRVRERGVYIITSSFRNNYESWSFALGTGVLFKENSTYRMSAVKCVAAFK